MATSREHWEQARGNEGFYENIGADRSNTPEWAMTILFYAALHYAQAGFAFLGTFPGDHTERKKALRTRFRAVAAIYESLEDASRRARYECEKPQPSELQKAKKQLADIAEEIAKSAPPTSYM